MGIFSKREAIPPTPEEQRGEWTRAEIMNHWRTIPDGMKLIALTHATDDQLRVMAWELPDPSDRFIAISEAKQRRALPELRRKIETNINPAIDEYDEVTDEDFRKWTAPVQQMHGRRLTRELVDQEYRQVFG